MKENKYDDDAFFEAYSNFPRFVEGLKAAGEWHVMERMLPPLAGKRVLDIGCGFGWHCMYALHGAAFVLGTDISQKMIRKAEKLNSHPVIEYRRESMEDMELTEGGFDVVISSLAFHYLARPEQMFRRIFGWTPPGGHFLFSVEHPVFTAEGTQQWVAAESGATLWLVDNYFTEGPRETIFLGHRVTKYHRTLASYFRALTAAGFRVAAIEEPAPSPQLLATVPEMADELRRPMMLIFSAVKGEI